uniref:Photosystem I reaction center subunit VIII n=1 Tax=Euglena mutabilis TaxID=38275 RepID=A0A1B0UL32_EUGMU|nr:photosystem I 4 kDa hydrophobic subunit [Euglena mutabilis]
MSASFLPTIFVPFIGLIFPFLVLGFFFSYIQEENKSVS